MSFHSDQEYCMIFFRHEETNLSNFLSDVSSEYNSLKKRKLAGCLKTNPGYLFELCMLDFFLRQGPHNEATH